MQITLPPDLETIVKRKLGEGFDNPVQVLSAALHLMEMQSDEIFANWDQDVLKQEIRKGLSDAEQGKFSTKTIDDIIGNLEKTHRDR